MSNSFKTYSPYTHSESVQIADGISQLIHDVGSIECTPSLSLSSVLHVPSFPVNLLSVISIIDQFKCIVTFDENSCVFQERGTGRRIRIGVGHNGLWFISHEESALIAAAEGDVKEILLLHYLLKALVGCTLLCLREWAKVNLYVMHVNLASILDPYILVLAFAVVNRLF
jgi:hypothetical protein